MNRREFIVTSAGVVGAIVSGQSVFAEPLPKTLSTTGNILPGDNFKLLFSRNKGQVELFLGNTIIFYDEYVNYPSKVLFYKDEMPSHQNQGIIKNIFDDYELYVQTESDKTNSNYEFPDSDLRDALADKPFTWHAWYQPGNKFSDACGATGYFNLLMSGVAVGRFEYSPNKPCMFEKWMYSGYGAEWEDRLANVIFDGRSMKLWCNSYRTAQFKTECVVHYRYQIVKG